VILGLIRLLIVLRDAVAFVGPLAKVYQFAALAAERAVTALAVPPHFLAAQRTDNYGLLCHRLQRTESKFKSHIPVIQSILGREVGGDETDVEDVFVGADFRNAWQVAIQ
jgi:hypothetical protein